MELAFFKLDNYYPCILRSKKDKLINDRLILMIKALFSKYFGVFNITGGQEL
jgi:hypothetical protein